MYLKVGLLFIMYSKRTLGCGKHVVSVHKGSWLILKGTVGVNGKVGLVCSEGTVKHGLSHLSHFLFEVVDWLSIRGAGGESAAPETTETQTPPLLLLLIQDLVLETSHTNMLRGTLIPYTAWPIIKRGVAYHQ